MDILFGRHGNTFGPNDKVVWVGRETDLDLVDKGWQQARAFGSALLRINMVPDRVYCASLKRTRGFADALGEVQMRWRKPEVDTRLDEIDYGLWAGLTSDEINATEEGRYALEGWTAHDQWPHEAGWGSRETEIKGNIQSFIDEVIATAGPKERILVVSSNGILRFFPKLLKVINQELPSYVMKTGHAGLISGEPGNFRVRFWNVSGEALSREYLA